MSRYRYLSFEPGLRQENGFFVDEENRILFWPTKEDPAHVLSLADAIALSRSVEANKNAEGCAVVFLLIAASPFLIILAFSIFTDITVHTFPLLLVAVSLLSAWRERK